MHQSLLCQTTITHKIFFQALLKNKQANQSKAVHSQSWKAMSMYTPQNVHLSLSFTSSFVFGFLGMLNTYIISSIQPHHHPDVSMRKMTGKGVKKRRKIVRHKINFFFSLSIFLPFDFSSHNVIIFALKNNKKNLLDPFPRFQYVFKATVLDFLFLGSLNSLSWSSSWRRLPALCQVLLPASC